MQRIVRLMALVLSMLAVVEATVASTFVGQRSDFRDETIYFVMTTRFYDGDPDNNTQCWDNQERNEGDPAWRGDFKGLIEKLDYIKALGFTAVWITPVVENASGYDYHGYHAFNFSRVDSRYESEDVDFQDLIDAAHERGMKIILDIVLNHTGNFGEENLCKLFTRDWSANQATIEECMVPITYSEGGRLPDNYNDLAGAEQYAKRLAEMKNTGGKNHDTNNYWHHVGNEWNWDDYSRWYGQIAGDCVDLNTENPYVTNYLVKCYGEFIKMGVDGFRIDTSGHISRLTFNKAFIPQFQQLAEEYKERRNGGPFFIYGEVCARERNVTYRNHENCSPYFYTWKESKEYAWDTSETSWNDIVVMEGSKGSHTNIQSVDAQGVDFQDDKGMPESSNAFLDGNNYHTPDYSQSSGMNVIDFTMHWNFRTAAEAFSVKYGDKYYNDATYNVVYVDSHDYAPDGAPEGTRFNQNEDVWAENLSLMFSFRGIPCLYYGSEIQFRKGAVIDNGPNIALSQTGRAYYGGYIKGDIEVSDFAQYSHATGNIAATLSHPLAMHIQRLNRIRAAVPALRKGQYSTDGCSGSFAFKRRYTDSTTDSYALVCISGGATFTGIENGTYTDAVTGDTKSVTNGTLTASCSGKGNMRVYVLSTDKTPAPGKVGDDGKYLYHTASNAGTQLAYDGTQEERSTVNGGSEGGNGQEEPETPIEPTMSEGEQAAFFENSAAWDGKIRAWVWSSSQNYTGGSWPGQTCTYLGNRIWKWSYTGGDKTPDGSGIIFNNGSSQTADMTWINGGYYNANGYVKTIEGAGEIPDKPDNPDTPDQSYKWRAYYNDSNWGSSTVYAYVWDAGDGNKEYLGGWPGKAMTRNSDGLWQVTFGSDKNLTTPMIIFNNGQGGGGSNQTADLSFINNGVYNYNGYQYTGMAEIASEGLRVYASGGVLYIDTWEDTTIKIVRADGIVYYKELGVGVNTITDLPRGVYIIASKKIVL
ncbi:MAG: starch-binding protein [Bacteroidaceae bacterium]|nr:starch-binding protein [Bacteroidaceae bacterium]